MYDILNQTTGRRVDIDFYIHNKGNSQAKLIFYTTFDSVYNNQLILERIEKGLRFSKSTYNMEFKNASIDKDMTYWFIAKTPILNPSYDKVTFHLFLLYKNDLGFLYSTYCWFHYKLIYPNFWPKDKKDSLILDLYPLFKVLNI